MRESSVHLVKGKYQSFVLFRIIHVVESKLNEYSIATNKACRCYTHHHSFIDIVGWCIFNDVISWYGAVLIID